MTTPVFDFIQRYSKTETVRLHMPGHKGVGNLGVEALDITEIVDADVLYSENGILKESQENASRAFGSAATLYSTEGSTLAIRAMLSLVLLYARNLGRAPTILAARNAHRSFLTGCALLDLDPEWFFGEAYNSPIATKISPESLEDAIRKMKAPPFAFYLTSPDYLGNVANIPAISAVCKKHGILLLVDNAHGAYLHFLPESHHPIHLGADLCCDSAHKTLPALTGAAYLHISPSAPNFFIENAALSMATFASTSPSYLILASLDRLNPMLMDCIPKKLPPVVETVFFAKKRLQKKGFYLLGSEPMKLSIATKACGYTGIEIAQILRRQHVEPEFFDPDHLVLMPGVDTSKEALFQAVQCLEAIKIKPPLLSFPPPLQRGGKVLSPREALFAPAEEISSREAKGRILAQPGVTCPPAVPIAVCGERLDEEALALFDYYDIKTVRVLK